MGAVLQQSIQSMDHRALPRRTWGMRVAARRRRFSERCGRELARAVTMDVSAGRERYVGREHDGIEMVVRCRVAMYA